MKIFIRRLLPALMFAALGLAFALPAQAAGKDNSGFGNKYFSNQGAPGFEDPAPSAARAMTEIEPAAGTEKKNHSVDAPSDSKNDSKEVPVSNPAPVK